MREAIVVDLPKKKVGIVACSGEELPAGTVTRLAALKVLEQLRPNETVTICLPLFLAGGEGDRAFAKFFPTIAVDGCELRCAARATEMYSNKPAASLVVGDIVSENRLDPPQGLRRLDSAGVKAVELTAQKLASVVDELWSEQWSRSSGELISLEVIDGIEPGPGPEPAVATCACGSGLPVQNVVIAGKELTLVGLPLIFQQFYEAGKRPDEANFTELMETIKIYNTIPAGEEPGYREGISQAYTHYWFKEKAR
ncbi:MAG: putative zinc-binding protein [Acidobacteriaceae bacterium]